MAQLAERRGDDARAMQSYRLLADSSLGLQARAAAARIMIRNGETEGAMAVLDEYVGRIRMKPSKWARRVRCCWRSPAMSMPH